MRSIPALAAALALLSGCVIKTGDGHTDPDTRRYGDITFLWNLGGRTCSEVDHEVSFVQVRIDGRSLQNGGLYNCNTAGYDGIKLLDFASGTYTFTIDALDAASRPLYTASGTVYVNGDVTQHVTLNRLTRQGQVNIFWSFGDTRASCANAGVLPGQPGVARMLITLDGAAPQSWDCRQSNGVEGVAIDLDPGTHTVQLEGIIASTDAATGQRVEQVWYGKSFTVNVITGRAEEQRVVLDPVAAAATFLPVLRDSAARAVTCSSAGVSKVWVQLTDWRGNTTPPFTGNCADYELRGFKWDWLLASETWDDVARVWHGTWTARMKGLDSRGYIVYEGVKQVQLYAGESDQTFTVDMPAK